MLGPRSIVERLDCDNDALQREADDAREDAADMRAKLDDFRREVLEELNGLKLVIEGRMKAIEEYLK